MITVINFICYIISGLAMILALSVTYFAYRMRKQLAIARAMMRHPASGLKPWDGESYYSSEPEDIPDNELPGLWDGSDFK